MPAAAAAAAAAVAGPLLAAALLLQLVSAIESSEARVQCMALCLTRFRHQVSQPLATTLSLDPTSLLTECTSSVHDLDFALRRDCDTCINTCNFFRTAKFGQYNTRNSFCHVLSKNYEKYNRSQESYTACQQASLELQSLFSQHPGSCPPATSFSSSSASIFCATAQQCNSSSSSSSSSSQSGDSLCSRRSEKCCVTPCGLSCVTAELDLSSLPPVPPAPTVTPQMQADGRQIKVRWSPYTWSRQEPVLFMLQLRALTSDAGSSGSSSSGSSSSLQNDWSDVTFGTRTQVLLREDQGRLTQVRVAAISARGSQGFSAASAIFGRRRSAALPSVRALSAGVHRLEASSVSVSIHWRLPTRFTAQLLHFQVKWRELRNSEGIFVKQEQVWKDQQEYWLINLKRDTEYKVYVRAVYELNGVKPQPSEWRSIIVSTSLTTADQAASSWNREKNFQRASQQTQLQLQQQQPLLQVKDCSCTQQPETPLRIHSPFFENGQLKIRLTWTSFSPLEPRENQFASEYRLEWAEKVCIESNGRDNNIFTAMIKKQEHEYTLRGLKFNCHYNLRMKGVDAFDSVVSEWSTCFCTESCKATPIRGPILPARCPNNEGSIIPQPPEKVSFELRQVVFNRQLRTIARIQWAAPLPLTNIISFRIKWGPRLPEDVSLLAYSHGLRPRINEHESQTQILPSGDRAITLYGLQPSTVYIVSLETVTQFGDSRPTFVYFETPGQRSRSAVQKYIHVGASASALRAQAAACIALLFAHWLAAL